MLIKKVLPILLTSVALVACRSGGERAYYDDGYNYSRGGFSFNSFDLIDTYDVDTRRSSTTPSLDSVNTDGKFSAFWRIDTQQNYEASLFEWAACYWLCLLRRERCANLLFIRRYVLLRY